jgi:hypothetical protein
MQGDFMKKENKEKFAPGRALTLHALAELRHHGFLYVRVDAFTQNMRPDYMEPHYFVLTPIKNLPDDVNKKGIYEPIDSPMLTDWANSPDVGIKVYLGKANM